MTKPTGRPKGRPKTKEYVTLMARVDVALADQVKRYAGLHRQPLSVVIRDALGLLMEEYPVGTSRATPHQLTTHDFLSDRYEAPLDLLLAETDSAERDVLLSGTNEAVIHSILSDTNTVQESASGAHGEARITSDTNEAHATILSDTKQEPAAVPDFDQAKYALGPLCQNGHEYAGTGQSLRWARGRHECKECTNARQRAHRHRTGQAKRAQGQT